MLAILLVALTTVDVAYLAYAAARLLSASMDDYAIEDPAVL